MTTERPISRGMAEVPRLVEVSSDPSERHACRRPGREARPGASEIVEISNFTISRIMDRRGLVPEFLKFSPNAY
jgi:hypothetical protein